MAGIEALEFRPVSEEEYPRYVEAVVDQFAGDAHPDDAELYRPVTDLDRTLAAFDRGRIVGTTDSIPFTVIVPGGAQPSCAGVTAVGVRSTHRRQGLLTALMRRQLDDVHERGEPLASLYASEAPIYGRYGYGPAAPAVDFRLERPYATLRAPLDLAGLVDLLEADEALKAFPAIHDRFRQTQPGMMSREHRRWQHWLGHDEERHRDGYSKRRHALITDRGYAVYRLKERWADNGPAGELRIIELVATDPEACTALWQFCFSVDLMRVFEASLRPSDDELPWLLDNAARLRQTVGDPLYMRLVDLPVALSERRYTVEAALVLDVHDPFCPWNTGRWRLEGGPDGAACERTDAPADLRVGARELAATYLGGVAFSHLARARLVDEDTPGGLARADLMFRAARQPWNAQIF